MEYTYIEKGTVKDNVLNLPQLTLEVTNACNLKCKYCGYGELYCGYDSRNNEMLSEEKVFRLLEYLHKGWSMSNSFHKKTYISFYGGEPLLNMALIKKVVKWIQDHPLPQCDFVFTMTTNGLLLSRYLDYLVEFDFKLLVSLDGDCSNNAYRVDFGEKSSFERVFENVKLAQQKYPDFFEKNISFNSVLHNLNNYQDIVRFFREEFEKMPSISELSASDVLEEKRDEYVIMRNDRWKSFNTMNDVEAFRKSVLMENPEVSVLCTYLHTHSGNLFGSYRDLLKDQSKKRYTPTGTCLPFEKKMFLTVNGKILPCERISHEYSLGYVTEEKVVLEVDEIEKMYNAFYEKYIPRCSVCYNGNTCKHCMFQNKNLKENFKCNDFMDKRRFEEYQEQMMSYLSRYPYLYKRIMEEVVIY